MGAVTCEVVLVILEISVDLILAIKNSEFLHFNGTKSSFFMKT